MGRRVRGMGLRRGEGAGGRACLSEWQLQEVAPPKVSCCTTVTPSKPQRLQADARASSEPACDAAG